MAHLVCNAVRCLNCGTYLRSYRVHDYKKCDCSNGTMVDGGLEYCRFGGKELSLVQTECVYNTDDFELVRAFFLWGTRGIDGKSPLKYVRLCELDSNHIAKIIEYIKKDAEEWRIQLFQRELEYRRFK